MHDFTSHVLQRYWEVVGWNPYNSYLYLTSTSSAVLDFPLPSGLNFAISASPSPPFFTTYRLRALPQLEGSLGYIFASTDEDAPALDVGSSRTISIKRMAHRFRILGIPRAPVSKDEIWQGGRRVDTRDYLLYGSMHVPSARVDALYTTRISPEMTFLLTGRSYPSRTFLQSTEKAAQVNATEAAQQSNISRDTTSGRMNVQLMLQRDTGRWFTEYSYSAFDALWGFRVLHNFGAPGSVPALGDSATSLDASTNTADQTPSKRGLDDDREGESGVGGGLKGRFSAGAEMFFSAREKSAGISTGLRFTTLPEPADIPAHGQEQVSQPPTTLTATLNPMMGHLSTAYAARMTRDIVACSRYDFNVYSYDSELTIGVEYWLRAARPAQASSPVATVASHVSNTADSIRKAATNVVDSVSTAVNVGTSAHRNGPSEDAGVHHDKVLSPNSRALSLRESAGLPNEKAVSSGTLTSSKVKRPPPSLRDSETLASPTPSPSSSPDQSESLAATISEVGQDALRAAPSRGIAPLLALIKARISTSGVLSLLWEGRMRNTLLSFGIRADVSPSALASNASKAHGNALRSVGMEITYFATGEEARLEQERRSRRQ